MRPVLIGHEKRWAALARAFAKGAVPQTLLISGPAQVGKWTLALRYAQLLLCPQLRQVPGPTGETLPEPCGQCRVCHQVEIGTFPDFGVYRPIVSSAKEERDWVIAPDALEGSVITVEMARRFGREALSKPLVGARKVMLINQADRMNIEAQNALLKTFEEPVPSLSIVLLTDNPSQLLPTVTSRCWHLSLGLVGETHIAAWLERTCTDLPPLRQQEWIQEAVRVAAGRPGAAYRELRRLQRAAASGNAAEGEPDQGKPNKRSTGKGAAKASGSAPPSAAASAAVSRFAQATAIVERIGRGQPVAALGLTEAAVALARLWWAEDQAGVEQVYRDLKKADAKVQRSAAARFLDELSNAYRAHWVAAVEGPGEDRAENDARPAGRRGVSETVWADSLDQIRKTRHYILHNANTSLALDVMFGRLIALHQAPFNGPDQSPRQASAPPAASACASAR